MKMIKVADTMIGYLNPEEIASFKIFEKTDMILLMATKIHGGEVVVFRLAFNNNLTTTEGARKFFESIIADISVFSETSILSSPAKIYDIEKKYDIKSL